MGAAQGAAQGASSPNGLGLRGTHPVGWVHLYQSLAGRALKKIAKHVARVVTRVSCNLQRVWFYTGFTARGKTINL